MLIGEYKHNLDNKGRLSLPSKFRNKFSEGIILTRGIDQCIFGFTKLEWEKVVKKLTELPLSQANARAFSRLILSGAYEIELDGQGRILIPEPLRIYANLEKRIVIVGMYTRIEIWDEKNWENYKKQTEESSQEIAERLSDLGI